MQCEAGHGGTVAQLMMIMGSPIRVAGMFVLGIKEESQQGMVLIVCDAQAAIGYLKRPLASTPYKRTSTYLTAISKSLEPQRNLPRRQVAQSRAPQFGRGGLPAR